MILVFAVLCKYNVFSIALHAGRRKETFPKKVDSGTFSGGGDGRCRERCLWSRCPGKSRRRVSFRKKADFSTFTMSSTLSKRIALIVRRIQSDNLLDYPLFAIKPPFHLKSSRCSFSKLLYTKHFPKHAMLDLTRSLMTWGKVNRIRGKSRHFPSPLKEICHGFVVLADFS